MTNLTDEQHVILAKQEYRNLKLNQLVKVDGIIISYVSEVIDNGSVAKF